MVELHISFTDEEEKWIKQLAAQKGCESPETLILSLLSKEKALAEKAALENELVATLQSTSTEFSLTPRFFATLRKKYSGDSESPS